MFTKLVIYESDIQSEKSLRLTNGLLMFYRHSYPWLYWSQVNINKLLNILPVLIQLLALDFQFVIMLCCTILRLGGRNLNLNSNGINPSLNGIQLQHHNRGTNGIQPLLHHGINSHLGNNKKPGITLKDMLQFPTMLMELVVTNIQPEWTHNLVQTTHTVIQMLGLLEQQSPQPLHYQAGTKDNTQLEFPPNNALTSHTVTNYLSSFWNFLFYWN